MLYEQWKAISGVHRQELALWDLQSDSRWTFEQLDAEAEKLPAGDPVIFASVDCPSRFIFEVLRAWRSGAVLCPLDEGRQPPRLEAWPGECVHIKTTSGSEGAPQMIAFTGAQLRADADNIVATMKLRAECPNLGFISLAHSYGFANLVLPLLLHGIPLVLAPSRLPEALRLTCQKFQGVTVPAVPALWRLWYEAEAIPPSIQLAVSAGAPLPVWLERAVFERCGLKIHNFYGASECGGICYDASPTPRLCDEDVGTPMANVTLETDHEGCLIVRSQAAGQTYWPKPACALGGGRFHSRDRAQVREGRVFLEGRRTDVINLAGQKVAPEAIERAILRHPDVRECVVFGVPERDTLRSELIVACVWTGRPLQSETLRQFLLEFLPPWQLPRQWWFGPAPSDEQGGKISRHQWRERFLGRNGPVTK
jgi:long-chain acyl-CoA synthetase